MIADFVILINMSVLKNIKLLNWIYFLANFNFYAPIAIIYFQHVTNSFALAASVFSVVQIAAAVFEIPTGIYSDMIGRKKTMLLGNLSMIFAVFMYALGFNYWVLLIGAVFEGMAISFFSGNNDAYLHNILSGENLEDKFHHYSGKLEAVVMLGTSGAALASGFIASWSFAFLMWVSLIPQVLCFIITLQLGEISIRQNGSGDAFVHLKEAFRAIKNNKNLRLLSLRSIFGEAFAPTAYQFQSAVFVIFWPLWAVGIVRALTEWLAIPATFYSGKIIDRLGIYKTMFINSIYSWFANIISVIFPSIFTPLIISTSAILWGAGDVAERKLLQAEFSDQQRATIASLNSLAGRILFAGFAFGMGIYADHFGPVKALLVVQLFFPITIVLLWKIYRNSKIKKSKLELDLEPANLA